MANRILLFTMPPTTEVGAHKRIYDDCKRYYMLLFYSHIEWPSMHIKIGAKSFVVAVKILSDRSLCDSGGWNESNGEFTIFKTIFWNALPFLFNDKFSAFMVLVFSGLRLLYMWFGRASNQNRTKFSNQSGEEREKCKALYGSLNIRAKRLWMVYVLVVKRNYTKNHWIDSGNDFEFPSLAIKLHQFIIIHLKYASL